MTDPAATVTVARNRPTRTADYGPAPEGHPSHGRQVGQGKRRRAARWTRQLRAGSTFQVGAQELEALEGWAKDNPRAARDLVITRYPAGTRAAELEARTKARQAAQGRAADAKAPKAAKGSRKATSASPAKPKA